MFLLLFQDKETLTDGKVKHENGDCQEFVHLVGGETALYSELYSSCLAAIEPHPAYYS